MSSPLCCLEASATDTSRDAERSFLFFKKKKKKDAAPADTTSTSSDYDKLTSGATSRSEGMFNVISKDGKYYFEIPRSLMGRDMLVVNKFLRVPRELNEAGANRGLGYAEQMVRFELDADKKEVRVRQQRPEPDVKPGDALARSVNDNYISPIMASFKLEAYSPDSSAVLIKVNDIYDGTKTSFNNVFNDINIGGSAKSDLSRIKSIKAFDNNIYAVSELTTSVTEPGGTVYVSIEVGSTLMLLPEKPMARRYVNPRVGYFTNSTLRYGDNQQRVSRGHYITRWRLEPKPGEAAAYLAGELVEPAKPIVFWLDNTIPPQWRPYIRKGIEDWNSAFEGAGFKNAVRVEQMPDSTDIDMDDVNYSVINYAASTMSNAMGPSLTDPRSGEILEADIMWWHNVLDILHDWIVLQTGAVDERARSLELPEELLGDAMRFVACHEVGHSLGLRHNMMASAAFPTDSLRSREFVNKLGGTASSIMDYARFNYIAQPGDGVEILSPHIGPYDRFAIEYGYRWYGIDDPELDNERLQPFLEAHNTPLYRYSEAQGSRDALDPRALSEDLGGDPVKSAQYGIANLKRIMPHIVEWTTTGKPGQDYDEASRLYYSAVGTWQRYAYHVLANVGGMYVDNTIVGDGNKTYSFVDADLQRQAVKYLIDEVYTYPAWLFDADVADYTYLVSNTPVGRMEHSPNFILKNAQSYLLWDMLADDRLVRMYENEALNGADAFKASEMMDMLHRSIFKKTIAGTAPDVRERSMQKNFVDALITAANDKEGVKINSKKLTTDADPSGLLVADPTEFGCLGHICGHNANGLAERLAAGERTAGRRIINFYSGQGNRISDAISLKRGELMRVRDLLKSRIPSAQQDAKYHYQDMLMRINTALGIAQ